MLKLENSAIIMNNTLLKTNEVEVPDPNSNGSSVAGDVHYPKTGPDITSPDTILELEEDTSLENPLTDTYFKAGLRSVGKNKDYIKAEFIVEIDGAIIPGRFIVRLETALRPKEDNQKKYTIVHAELRGFEEAEADSRYNKYHPDGEWYFENLSVLFPANINDPDVPGIASIVISSKNKTICAKIDIYADGTIDSSGIKFTRNTYHQPVGQFTEDQREKYNFLLSV